MTGMRNDEISLYLKHGGHSMLVQQVFLKKKRFRYGSSKIWHTLTLVEKNESREASNNTTTLDRV